MGAPSAMAPLPLTLTPDLELVSLERASFIWSVAKFSVPQHRILTNLALKLRAPPSSELPFPPAEPGPVIRLPGGKRSGLFHPAASSLPVPRAQRMGYLPPRPTTDTQNPAGSPAWQASPRGWGSSALTPPGHTPSSFPLHVTEHVSPSLCHAVLEKPASPVFHRERPKHPTLALGPPPLLPLESLSWSFESRRLQAQSVSRGGNRP